MLWLVVVAAAAAVVAGVDETRTEYAVGADVVDAVVDLITQSCIFTNDKLMLRRLAKVETADGTADHTFTRNGMDFYGGIWQVNVLTK